MKIELNEMTVSDERIRARLLEYLGKVSQYKNFDENADVRVYVNNDMDFCAFEGVHYRIQFTSNLHKLNELIASEYNIEPVSFRDFKRHIMALSA